MLIHQGQVIFTSESVISYQKNMKIDDLVRWVSIIIPTMNSSKTIGKCLKVYQGQTYQRIQIFVIDRFSLDNTAEIASRFDASIYLFAGEE